VVKHYQVKEGIYMIRLIMQDEYGVYWLEPATDCGDSFKAWWQDSRLIIAKNDPRLIGYDIV